MVIKKVDMKVRIAQAATAAPNIADRLRHAAEMSSEHPVATAAPAMPPVTPVAEVTVNSSRTGKHESPIGRLSHQLVSIDLIDQNPFNARRIYRPERVSQLAASISTHGQETPGTATLRNGRYILAAGHYRLRALKALGAKNMELMIRDSLSDRELYEVSFRENAERETQSSYDNALSWRQLLSDGVYASETEIAEVTGMSLPNVNKTLAALRISPAVLDLVAEDPSVFPLSVLYELALYEPVAGTENTRALARQVMEGAIGRKQIQDARAEHAAQKPRKRKETSRQYKMHLQGEAIGSLKEWDSGKVAFEIQVKDPTTRAAIVTELRARFSTE